MLLRFCVGALVGVIVGGLFEVSPSLRFASLGVGALGLLTLRLWHRPETGHGPGIWPKRRKAAILGFATGLGLVPPAPANFLEARGVATVWGQALRTETSPDRSYLEVHRLVWAEGSPHFGRPAPPETPLVVRIDDVALPSRARVSLTLNLKPALSYRNRQQTPEWHFAGQTTAVGTRVRHTPLIVLHRPLGQRTIAAIRARIRRRLESTLSPRASGLARAFVLGEAHALSRQDRDSMRNAGLAHLLAVSGLHIGLAAWLVYRILSAILRRFGPLAARFDTTPIAAVGSASAAGFYCLLSGASPSAVRAALTAALILLLRALGRRPPITTLGPLAILVMAAVSPSIVHRPAFLLSSSALLAIVTNGSGRDVAERADGQDAVGRRATRAIRRVWMRTRSATRVSARAILATTPLSLWWFESLPVLGLAANVVIVPFVSLVVIPIAGIHAAVASLDLPLQALSGFALEYLAQVSLRSSDLFSTYNFGESIPPLGRGQIIAVGLLCLAWLTHRSIRDRLASTAVLLTVIAALEWSSGSGASRLQVTFLDVGQGDAALIALPNERAMLVDGGGGPLAGRRALLPLLRSRRISRIDVAVLTHGHPDHYSGLIELAETLPIAELWTTPQAEAESPNGQAADLVRNLRSAGTQVRYPHDLCRESPLRSNVGEGIPWSVEVIWPCTDFAVGYDAGFAANNGSLVIRLQYGRRSFLFTGDIEEEAEAALLRQHLRPVDVLKVAHHGSRTSSTSAFIAMVRPRLAIVSSGVANRYRHPHPEAVARLLVGGAQPLSIAEHGSVDIVSDGENLDVHTYEGERFRLARDRPTRLASGPRYRRRSPRR